MPIKLRHLDPDDHRAFLIRCYEEALNEGDLETVGEVLEFAVNDPALDELIYTTNQRFARELGLNIVSLRPPNLPSFP